jgi:hypothetical protein
MSLFLKRIIRELIPEDNAGQRARIIQTYFRLLVKQGDYLSKLSENQREIFLPFTLPRLSDDLFWKKSTLHREVSQEQKHKRSLKQLSYTRSFIFFAILWKEESCRLTGYIRRYKAFKQFEQSAKNAPFF